MLKQFLKQTLELLVSRKIFIFRAAVFAVAVILSLFDQALAVAVFYYELAFGVRVYHLLWGFLMLEMILALAPGMNHFMGRGKVYEKNYVYLKHDPGELKNYTKKYNQRAVIVALAWAGVILLVGLLNFKPYLVVMLVILFYFLDQLFVNVWCPLQHLIVHNRCCATCRIYSWGFPIIVSPLVYIKSFWSYSLLAVGALLLFQWEYLHHLYPERFSELANAALSCRNCTERCRKRGNPRSGSLVFDRKSVD